MCSLLAERANTLHHVAHEKVLHRIDAFYSCSDLPMLRHFLVVVGTALTGIRRPRAAKQRPSLQGTTMQLIIGNKNYSSWSMRSWVLLRHFGIPFTERKLHFDFNPGSAFYAELARITPAAKVPVLVEDDGFAVWDTLAIAEYIADVHPEHTIWPRDARPRARARSLCAEMHAGFTQLRSLCPMNIEAPLQHLGPELFAREEGLRGNLGRVGALIEDALRASGGPFLFGAFGAVDAYYAPVAMRIRSYGLPVSDTVASYVERLAEAASVCEWVADALAEHDFVAEDEPYRQAPARHRPKPGGGSETRGHGSIQ